MLYKQFYIPVIWKSVSLAFCGNRQADFGRQVKIGKKTLSRAAEDNKWKINDPGKIAI